MSNSKGGFNNAASMVGFIHGYDSIDAVIEADTRDLTRIGGSFEEIGDRMTYLIKQVDEVLSPQRSSKRELIFRQVGYEAEDYWNIPNDIRQEIDKKIDALYNTPVLIPGESRIELVDLHSTRGVQSCPFDHCDGGLSSKDYIIRNTETGRRLWINPMTAHLASKHHLLEKGNNYGITAVEFYEHFMDKR